MTFANPSKLNVFKMRSIAPFYSLKDDKAPMSRNLCSIFKNLVNVTEFDVGVCGSAVSDDVLQTAIRRMAQLRRLKVCESKITDRGVAGVDIDDFDSRLSPSVVSKRRLQASWPSLREEHCVAARRLSVQARPSVRVDFSWSLTTVRIWRA